MNKFSFSFVLFVLCFVSVRAVIPESSTVIFGDYRVQVLTDDIIRVEQKGKYGFEDRPSFTAANLGSFSGAKIRKQNKTETSLYIATNTLAILLNFPSSSFDVCAQTLPFTEFVNPVLIEEYPNGIAETTLADCCKFCQNLSMCTAWDWQPSTGTCRVIQSPGTYSGETRVSERTTGWPHPPVQVSVLDPRNDQVLAKWPSLDAVPSRLPFPSLGESGAVLGLKDSPKIIPPAWGATLMPSNYSGKDKETNGFDLESSSPDVYFMRGEEKDYPVESYERLRKQFMSLTGPIPALPDHVFGTWFSWWHAYTQTEAMEDVSKWASHNISLDIFGLDIDWRDTSQESEYVVNKNLFPDMPGFLKWAHDSAHVHTYFNDHPESHGKQMSPQEINFRYKGLTGLMNDGLDFWWYDSNWHKIIPGVFGLDNRVWVQYVFRSVTERFNNEKRGGALPFTLAMFSSDHPAHHRFPVWWTGDINTAAFEENMHRVIDSGAHLKPYVHPDCGGFIGKDTDTVYTRWIQFCSMSTLIRVHSSVLFLRQPWSYSTETENIVRKFIALRYSLLPTIVTAARNATESGMPLAQRLDLRWPQYKESHRSDEYLWLNDILVAPVNPFPDESGKRDVWFPPGTWKHLFDGSVVKGPQTMTIDSPVDYIPMYYRTGSMLMTTAPAQTTRDQHWNTVFLEVFPNEDSTPVTRVFFDTKSDEKNPPRITVTFNPTNDNSAASLLIKTDRITDAWNTRKYVVRLHGDYDKPRSVSVDGALLNNNDFRISQDEMPQIPSSGPQTIVAVVNPTTNNHSSVRVVKMVW